MAPDPESDSAERTGVRPARRVPTALVTGAFIIVVLAIVVVLLVVKVTRGTTTVESPPVAPAPAAVVHSATTVPQAVFNAVGAPVSDGPGPVTLSGQPPLSVAGHPAIVFVGAEFSPYSAAERWALVVALARFGTFGHLGATSSSAYEAFAQTATFSFDGATYRSRYLSFSAVEAFGPTLSPTAPAGFPALRHPTALQQALMRRYDGSGNVGTGATLPFVDVDNRVLLIGAGIGFSPGVLQGSSLAQVAGELADPASPVAQAVVGAANVLSAALCAATGQEPLSVCSSPGVRAGASRLSLTSTA